MPSLTQIFHPNIPEGSDKKEADSNRALQAAAHELERQKVTDSLKKGLEKRPQREDLVERTFPSPYRVQSHLADVSLKAISSPNPRRPLRLSVRNAS